MKKWIVATFVFLFTLIGCGEEIIINLEESFGCSVSQLDSGVMVTCADGTVIEIPRGLPGSDGVNGEDGVDGANGEDGIMGPQGPQGEPGEDAVLLTISKLDKNDCSQIYPGLWAQNLANGYVFDVYTNHTCNDFTDAEVCDNVATSFGADDNPPSGNSHPGGGDTCWYRSIMLTGIRLSNGDINVYVLDFN